MLRIPKGIRVFASRKPINFSMDVDGLVSRVRAWAGGEDPFTGNIFCFFNRRRDRVKLLVWDRNGFWTLSKRLERGCFEALDGQGTWAEVTREWLVMMLHGVDTKTGRFRRNFAREMRMSSRGDEDRSERTPE